MINKKNGSGIRFVNPQMTVIIMKIMRNPSFPNLYLREISKLGASIIDSGAINWTNGRIDWFTESAGLVVFRYVI